MWRGLYNEDWERQREIITRTLFHDIPLLSPVPEEEDSQNESFAHVSPSSIEARKPVDNASRPWSPLPPLIIEKEPNRHDEPEEYYNQLAQRMKKLHRKLFIEDRSLDTIEYSTDEILAEPSSDKTPRNTFSIKEHEGANQMPNSNGSFEDEPSHSMTDSDNSSSLKDEDTDTNNFNRTQNEHSKKMNNSSNNEDYTANKNLEDEKNSTTNSDANEDNPELSRTENHAIVRECRQSTSSSNTAHYEQVTFQAEIHLEPGMGDEPEPDMSLVYGRHVSVECDDQQHDDALLERTRISDIIARNLSVHLHTRELEVMRTPREPDVHTSFGTPTPHEASSDDVSVEVDRHSLEDNPFDILKYTRRSNFTEIDQCSDDFNITLHSSTPKIANKRRISTENVFDKYTTSSSPKRIRYESVATQCNEISDWSSLCPQFFVGTPKIFKLCSCKDHRCGC